MNTTNDRVHYGDLPDGRAVTLYRLHSPAGACAEILDFGGNIHSLTVPDRRGTPGDIVMGHETFQDQMTKMGWNCGLMGRCVNRIDQGKLFIHGKLHQLELMGGMPFVIHGGKGNYAMKLFSAERWSDNEGDKLRLYHHDCGEGGFPGQVDVWVTYVLTPDNELQIEYRALPTEDTVLNITSHCYFNLAGHGSGTVANQLMQINADYFLPAAEGGLPTGEVLRVEDSVFDFTNPRRLGDGLESNDPQIKRQGGYDHNYCLRGAGYRQAANAYDEKSGRRMIVYTDMPGVQLYTAGNDMPGDGFKGGASYHKYDAFCLETQYFPDATAYSHFPQPIFSAGKVFKSQTAFRFTVD